MPPKAITPPVKVKTRGGLDATIFEIDPGDLQDGISGTVFTPAMGEITKSWSEAGKAFQSRQKTDAWAKDAAARREPLGAVASRGLKSIDIDPHDPVVAAVINQLRAARLQ